MVKAFFSIFLNLPYWIAALVPKQKNLWIFSAWNGRKYSDNPKYVFEYVCRHRKDVEAVWCTKDRQFCRELAAVGIPCVYAYSLKGAFCQMRAAVALFTHSVDWEFCAYFMGPKTRRVQLWHGMPIKKIGYDSRLQTQPRLKELLLMWLLPFRAETFDFMIATGDMDAAIYQSAFRIGPDKLRITGFPRNDHLWEGNLSHRGSGTTKVLFMPTFRGKPGSEFTLFADMGFDFEAVDAWLAARNCSLHIKLHPVNRFSPSDLNRIQVCTAIFVVNGNSDIYETLAEYDMMVTDFSSIYFDFILTGRPVIVAPLGLSEYLEKDRDGFYFDYKDLAPEGLCPTWDAVLAKVEHYALRPNSEPVWRALQHRFHRHLDGQAARRLCEQVDVMLSAQSSRYHLLSHRRVDRHT